LDDRAAWVRDALERFEGPLLLYAGRLVGDEGSARDVVQDVFLRLCEQDRAEVSPRLGPWLFAVCRNRAMDERRREKKEKRVTTTEAESGAAVADRTEMRDDLDRAMTAVDALPAAQQEVVRLKFRHGLSYREIAEVTGMSVSHVGVRIHEAMKALRARLTGNPAVRAVEGGAR
jgi:RNA polymerase sigma-70 factor (ECF subfamily)